MHQRVVGVRRAGVHGDVHREAPALARADLVGGARAWIKRKLVRRDVEHSRILVEDRLRPVAVVHVDIDNGDALEASGEHRGRGDGNIVEKAEAHRAIRFGVVTRRAHQGEGRLARLQPRAPPLELPRQRRAARCRRNLAT